MTKICSSIPLYSPSWRVVCAPSPPSSLPLAPVMWDSACWLPFCPLESLGESQSLIFVPAGPGGCPSWRKCSANVLQKGFSKGWRRKELLGWEEKSSWGRGRGGKALRVRCFKLGWGLSCDSAMDRWSHSSVPLTLRCPQSAVHTDQSHLLIARPPILLCPFGWGQWVWHVSSYPVSWRWSHVTSSPTSLLFCAPHAVPSHTCSSLCDQVFKCISEMSPNLSWSFG